MSEIYFSIGVVNMLTYKYIPANSELDYSTAKAICSMRQRINDETYDLVGTDDVLKRSKIYDRKIILTETDIHDYQKEHPCMFLAYSGETLVGVIAFSLPNNPNEPMSYVDLFYVDFHHRFKGIGTKLLQKYSELSIRAKKFYSSLRVLAFHPYKKIYNRLGYDKFYSSTLILEMKKVYDTLPETEQLKDRVRFAKYWRQYLQQKLDGYKNAGYSNNAVREALTRHKKDISFYSTYVGNRRYISVLENEYLFNIWPLPNKEDLNVILHSLVALKRWKVVKGYTLSKELAEMLTNIDAKPFEYVLIKKL